MVNSGSTDLLKVKKRRKMLVMFSYFSATKKTTKWTYYIVRSFMFRLFVHSELTKKEEKHKLHFLTSLKLQNKRKNELTIVRLLDFSIRSFRIPKKRWRERLVKFPYFPKPKKQKKNELTIVRLLDSNTHSFRIPKKDEKKG